jgi:hypothetical protein
MPSAPNRSIPKAEDTPNPATTASKNQVVKTVEMGAMPGFNPSNFVIKPQAPLAAPSSGAQSSGAQPVAKMQPNAVQAQPSGGHGQPMNPGGHPYNAPGYVPQTPNTPWGYKPPAPYGFTYSPGSRVQVTWSNGQRYPATVSQVQGSQCLVVFPDGQQHWIDVQFISPA